MWIYYNQLSGSIPGSLGNLFNLETLALSPGNDELCAPNDEAFQAWLKSIGDLRWTGPTCTADAVQPKPADEVQATVEAAVAAGGGRRAGGPPVTIDMSTLFSLGEGGSADTTFTARSSDPALVLAEVTDERLVLTPGNAQLSNLVGVRRTRWMATRQPSRSRSPRRGPTTRPRSRSRSRSNQNPAPVPPR